MSSRWQLDLCVLPPKRRRRPVYLVTLVDEASLLIVGHGLFPSATASRVLEVTRSALASHEAPREIVVSRGLRCWGGRGWRALVRELGEHGIRLVMADPRRPEPIGPCERQWRRAWRNNEQEVNDE